MDNAPVPADASSVLPGAPRATRRLVLGRTIVSHFSPLQNASQTSARVVCLPRARGGAVQAQRLRAAEPLSRSARRRRLEAGIAPP
jgi:hypothetical protein